MSFVIVEYLVDILCRELSENVVCYVPLFRLFLDVPLFEVEGYFFITGSDQHIMHEEVRLLLLTLPYHVHHYVKLSVCFTFLAVRVYFIRLMAHNIRATTRLDPIKVYIHWTCRVNFQ